MLTCFVLALYHLQIARTENHPEYCKCFRMYSFTRKYLLTWRKSFLGKLVNALNPSFLRYSGHCSESEDVTEKGDCEYLVVDFPLGTKGVLKQKVSCYQG